MYFIFSRPVLTTDHCFFTDSTEDVIQVSVFPDWLVDRYDLRNKYFKMLAGNMKKYGEMQMPLSRELYENHILPLENKVQKAFEAGYEEVSKLPEETLFYWMTRIYLGTILNNIYYGQEHEERSGQEFSLSIFLKQKFANLHLMYQALFRDVEFTFTPWSIAMAPVAYFKDVFNYRDDPKKLYFSLGMNGFGFVACLQDNGMNKEYHQSILKTIEGKVLHAAQFEELCARFIYSNYNLRIFSTYAYEEDENGKIIIRIDEDERPDYFKTWSEKDFSQVLGGYMQPWGLTSDDVYRDPDTTISFIQNAYTDAFIEMDEIDLPT